jgi:hypothetical protein
VQRSSIHMRRLNLHTPIPTFPLRGGRSRSVLAKM